MLQIASLKHALPSPVMVTDWRICKRARGFVSLLKRNRRSELNCFEKGDGVLNVEMLSGGKDLALKTP